MPATIRHWTRASPVMLAGTVNGHRDQAAEVGQEALGAGVPHVVLDHLVDRPVDVAVLLLRAACRRPRRPAGAGRRRGSRGAAPRARTPRSGRARAPSAARAADPSRCWWSCRDPTAMRPIVRSEIDYRGARAGRPAPERLGVPAARRASTPTTTWSPPAPTSSRARCWRPTGAGCSRCRSGGRRAPMAWFSPVRRGVLRPRDLHVSRSLRQVGAPVRDPGRHRVRRGDRRLRRPAPAVGLDRRPDPRRRTSGCTSSAGCTRSRPGATAGSSAGCTAWPSAACSPASRCSTTRPTPRRSRWSGWCALLDDGQRPAARHAVADPAPRVARGLARCRARSTSDLLAQVLRTPPTSTSNVSPPMCVLPEERAQWQETPPDVEETHAGPRRSLVAAAALRARRACSPPAATAPRRLRAERLGLADERRQGHVLPDVQRHSAPAPRPRRRPTRSSKVGTPSDIDSSRPARLRGAGRPLRQLPDKAKRRRPHPDGAAA